MGRKTLILILVFCSCSVHHVRHFRTPCVCIPDEFLHAYPGGKEYQNWWEEFGDEGLNQAIQLGLANNLDLQRAWFRLVEACAQARVVGADLYPKIDYQEQIRNRVTTVKKDGATSSSDRNSDLSTLLIAGKLSYEVDIWKRICSKTKSAYLEADATYEDWLDTGLFLSATIADIWFTIQEQKALLDLLAEQIATNRTLLELVELRFVVGEASALDVYQQRLQLATTESRVPPVQAVLDNALHQLSILLGRPPEEYPIELTGILFADLPEKPYLGTPVALLWNRPDLKAAHQRLIASDYEVAAAIADRFPRLMLAFTEEFTREDFKRFFEREVRTICADLIGPLIDGGRRRAEVDRRSAILCRNVKTYAETFLIAMREVSDAIMNEFYQLDLINRLIVQEDLAKKNLVEAKWHYVNGLNDYLTVIAAIQSLQNVQLRIINERKKLLSFRSQLYRSLGGFCYNYE